MSGLTAWPVAQLGDVAAIGLAVVAGVGLAGCFVYMLWKQRDRRTPALRALAAARGFSWSESPSQEVPPYPPFEYGREHEAVLTMRGRGETGAIQLGDFRFQTTVEAGYRKLPMWHYHRFSYVLIELPDPARVPQAVLILPLFDPPFTVAGVSSPFDYSHGAVEHSLNQVAGEDVVPADSRLVGRYRLRAANPAAAQALLTPAVAALLAGAPARTLYVGAAGLLVLQGDRCWTPTEFELTLAFGQALVRALPVVDESASNGEIGFGDV